MRVRGANFLREHSDGLRLALCGAGSPMRDPQRSGPCAAVVAGGRLFIVDTGAGATRNIARLDLPLGGVEAILLTHFHSDHIDGLGELLLQRWVTGTHTSPTPVHGPSGVESVVDGFNRAYAHDRGYRVAHHGEDTVPPTGFGAVARPFPLPPEGHGQVLLDDGSAKITAFRVEHAPVTPAVGYRFDHGGRSLILSGDTIKSANLQAFAQGADLLVHEALAPQLVRVITRGANASGRANVAKITRDILDYHVVPPLVLTTMESIFLEGVDEVYHGPVTVGRDGTTVHLATGSREIRVEELF